MASRHFFHDPSRLVSSALRATAQSNPHLGLDEENKIIYVRPEHFPKKQRVSVISGGGCGHEPSFAAMVGNGLLSSAISGTIFASPTAKQVYTAIIDSLEQNKTSIDELDHQYPDSGVLVTVMNYTGDMLNFGLAVEKAQSAGYNINMLAVGDDVGVGRNRAGKVGRRGVAGTVLVHKISGALAAQGYGLSDVSKAARLTSENLVSVAARLERVHVPGQSVTRTNLDPTPVDEVEIGIGIHNEGGVSWVKNEISEVVSRMLAQLLDPNDLDRAFVDIRSSDEVILLVNNLGGLSPLGAGRHCS